MPALKSKKPGVITCGIYLYSTLLKKILVCHATRSSWKLWSIPKGLKEDNEDSFTAAARELKEETNIDISGLHVVSTHELEKVKYQKQNKFLESFLVITDSDLSEHTFECLTYFDENTPEVDKWKWISVEEIPKFLHESQQKNYDRIVELIGASR